MIAFLPGIQNTRQAVAAFLLFTCAYFMTITVNAQETVVPGDAILVQENNDAIITGTIVSLDDDSMRINASGKDMIVDLDNVDLNTEAGSLFQRGMKVSVRGELEGDDFGTPIIDARSVTATQESNTVLPNVVPQ